MNTGKCRNAVMLALLVSGAVSAESHTVFLVRHAEKATEPASDPPLSAAGMQRADTLVHLLANAKPVAIYTSQYQRTQLTAKPLADAVGIAHGERFRAIEGLWQGEGAVLARLRLPADEVAEARNRRVEIKIR